MVIVMTYCTTTNDGACAQVEAAKTGPWTDIINQFTAIMTTHVVIQNVMYCAIMTKHVVMVHVCKGFDMSIFKKE